MVLAVVVLNERLRRPQRWALGVGVVAVVVLSAEAGHVPWVGLVLATTFGTYGLCRKSAGVGAVEGLAFETLLVSPIAIGYLAWLAASGDGALGTSLGASLLLVSSGLVTAVPLVMFGAAATRIPMVSLGLLQYLTPVIQFSLGVMWFHEPMAGGRWLGFGLVWLGLAVFTVDAWRSRSRSAAVSRHGVIQTAAYRDATTDVEPA